MSKALGCLGVLLLLFSARANAEEKWLIHEWGTFTSLQDEAGEAIGGINTDDEPVPPFVHRLSDFLLLRPTEVPPIFFQGTPRCHPDVTMRLETPIVYFHPPASAQHVVHTARLAVGFRGGWLTEYFPAATPSAPGLSQRGFQFGALRSNTDSKLEWNDLKIGGRWALTNTSEHVWTSPRAVKAALVQAANGESEKFLFYRGVANIKAPLRISREAGASNLLLRSQLDHLESAGPLPVRSLWLVHVRTDGKLAFRPLPPIVLQRDSNRVLARVPSNFTRGEFSSANLEKLKRNLETALISEGLFADEARALLNTWELSYFKSAGTRVFFIVPPVWTDFYLPLETSLPAEVKRVMVGRIELVMPEQRKALQSMAGYSTNEIRRQAMQLRNRLYSSGGVGVDWNDLTSGKKPLATTIPVPESYRAYLGLGRFRNALILDQARKNPTDGLHGFINTYGLQAYQPVEASSDPSSDGL